MKNQREILKKWWKG